MVFSEHNILSLKHGRPIFEKDIMTLKYHAFIYLFIPHKST